MTISLRQFLVHVEKLAVRSGSRLGENATSVDFAMTFASKSEFHELWNLASKALSDGLELRSFNELGDRVGSESDYDDEVSGSPINFRLMKPEMTTPLALTHAGFDAILSSLSKSFLPNVIYVADDFQAFNSLTTQFLKWGAAPSLLRGTTPIQGDTPRRLVRDLTAEMVPESAAAWIVEGNLPSQSAVFDIFTKYASQNLRICIANEVWREKGVEYVAVKGDRNVRMAIKNTAGINTLDFEALNRCALWVFGNHSDSDVRHTLLSNELSREYDERMMWAPVAARMTAALEHAEAAYRHHLRGQAKDAIKNMLDLRKAVGEEAEKTAAQTKDLISNLWRDFAIAIGAAAVRASSVAVGGSQNRYSAYILLGTATFLIFSISINIFINSQFHKHNQTIRSEWFGRVYGYLGTSEFERLCTHPLREVRWSYNHARMWVVLAYIALIIFLLAAGYSAL